MSEKDKLLDHNYDGIQEYDNDLPRWWVQIFWLTTFFAIFYIVYNHYVDQTPDQKLAKQLEELKAQSDESQKSGEKKQIIGEAGLALLVKDTQALAKGKSVYDGKCLACHGANGEGLVGPNMTDTFWIHGGELVQIRNTIIKGVPEKGMIPWQGLLTSEEINTVTAYIWSLQGTNPANQKAAEGKEYIP